MSNAMQYGTDKEKEALYFYQRLCLKKHQKVVMGEPRLLVDLKNLWMEVSLDIIRQRECCVVLKKLTYENLISFPAFHHLVF